MYERSKMYQILYELRLSWWTRHALQLGLKTEMPLWVSEALQATELCYEWKYTQQAPPIWLEFETSSRRDIDGFEYEGDNFLHKPPSHTHRRHGLQSRIIADLILAEKASSFRIGCARWTSVFIAVYVDDQ